MRERVSCWAWRRCGCLTRSLFNLSSGVRPHSKANCGWLRPCTLGDFCFGKSHQNHLPRSARKLPPFLAPPGARPTRRALNYAPRAQTRSRLNAPDGAAVLGARYGVWSNTLPCLIFALVAFHGFVCWYIRAYRQVRYIPYKELPIYLINLLSFQKTSSQYTGRCGRILPQHPYTHML
jgi:hypothetical protein